MKLSNSLKRNGKDLFIKASGILLVILCWWIVSLYLPPSRLPSPLAVLRELGQSMFDSVWIKTRIGGSGLFPHLMYSLGRWAAGATAGALLGIAVGLLLGLNKAVRDFCEPPLEFIRSVPPLAMAPFFILWFGLGTITQLLVVAFFAFMRLVIFTVEAIKNVQPVQQQFALTLGASRKQLFKAVILPAIFPELIGGLRVVMATSWGIVIVAEMMGSKSGIGRCFSVFITVLAAKEIIAAIIWVTIIAALTDAGFLLFARRLTKWVPGNQ
jgi:ABC-type nitrate/sulfonate/bicarbonate transport system permease component